MASWLKRLLAGRASEPSKGSEPPEDDAPKLATYLEEAVAAIETILRDTPLDPADEPYAIVVSAGPSLNYLAFHAMTEAALARRLAQISDVDDANRVRWGWEEWMEGEFYGDHSALGTLSRRMEPSVYRGWHADFEEVQAFVCDIIRTLDQRGAFGSGAAREAVLVYPGIYDAGVEAWTYDMARELNPAATFAKADAGGFRKAFIW